MNTKLIGITLIMAGTLGLFGCKETPRTSPGTWGYIDKTGKVVVPAQFAEGLDFADGLAAVKIGENWGYIDQTGKAVISPQFAAGRNFAGGMAAVKIKDNWGY